MKNALLITVVFLSGIGTIYSIIYTGNSKIYVRKANTKIFSEEERNLFNEYKSDSVVFTLKKKELIEDYNYQVNNIIPAENWFYNFNKEHHYQKAFKNIETNIQLRNEEEKLINKDILAYEGTYSFGNKKYIGIVDFKGIQDSGDLNFIISIGSARGCTSSLKGKATFKKANIATYQDSASGCNISFMFNKNKLEIRENKCRLFHGATCQFFGKFNKEVK